MKFVNYENELLAKAGALAPNVQYDYIEAIVDMMNDNSIIFIPSPYPISPIHNKDFTVGQSVVIAAETLAECYELAGQLITELNTSLQFTINPSANTTGIPAYKLAQNENSFISFTLNIRVSCE